MYTPSLTTKSSSPQMEELKKAAIRGDVEFLRKSVALNKHRNYYLTLFPKNKPDDNHNGNIFHIAVLENRVDFIREGIEILPLEVIQHLLLQQCEEAFMYNPLHVAASIGNAAIVKMILDVMKSTSPSTNRRKPWLEKNSTGQTPCHVALVFGYVDCALEILKMDMEMLCNMSDNHNFGLLHAAVFWGFNRFSLEILSSANSFSCSGPDGITPLHGVTNCLEGEEICRRLLQRKPELIKQKDKFGGTVLHWWAKSGKLWSFECVLNNNDNIPEIRSILVDLMCTTDDKFGFNPLHILASLNSSEKDAIKIAQLLIDNYNKEVTTHSSSIISKDHVFPWLVQSKKGDTPLSLAIERRYESFAMYLLSVDNDVLIKCAQNALFLAINKGCHEVAKMIIKIVDNKGWTQLLTSDHQLNVLHLAPSCTVSMGQRLLKQHPELLEAVDENGNTILHSWIKHSQIGLFKYLIYSGEVDPKWRSYFIKLISSLNYDGNNPLHVVANSTHDEVSSVQVTNLVVKAYKEETCNLVRFSPASLPWFVKNKDGEGPLQSAIYNKREKLALYILSLYKGDHINELLDYYKPEHNNTLFLAIDYNCFQVAKEILARLDKGSRAEYLVDYEDGLNILHLATSCKDKDFGVWLVNEAPEYIIKGDCDEETPLNDASNVGASWIIQAMLKKNPYVLNLAPLAWVKACEKGHVSTICAFIDNHFGNFRDLCIKHKDSPLHHIKLLDLWEYEDFLRIPRIKDLINIQDSEGATPLHKAIRNRNIFLVEALLKTNKLMYNIKDKKDETPIELLEQVCDEDYEWYEMCKRAGFYSRIKMPSFERKTEILETREALLVVSAIIAAITFIAGFNLPGGFNQDTGETILLKKAIFFMFLVSDTLALCSSILVLISLVWSMIYDSKKSLLLIDRSMVLFLISLYSTLLAFMTGVYVVTSPNSLWASIVIIMLCCVAGISANGTILYNALDKLIPSANKQYKPNSSC